MQKYINTADIPIALAVFLAADFYDHQDDPNHISATALLKPLRQIVLTSRVPAGQGMADLGGMMASRMGTAIHDGIERAWKQKYAEAMEAIGIPNGVIKRIRINPKPEELSDEIIPVYLEQRAFREVAGRTISGQMDFIIEGGVEDFKSTGVFTYTSQTSNEKYILQLSILKWLNSDKITQDQGKIHFIFTDWSNASAFTNPKYPKRRFLTQTFDLLTVQQTDQWIRTRLAAIEKYWTAEETEIPYCTDEELWRSEPQFKYYKNPDKTARSTKNFDTLQEAMIRKSQDGGVGIVKEAPGKVKACKYCSAFAVCTQKDQLIAAGDLTL